MAGGAVVAVVGVVSGGAVLGLVGPVIGSGGGVAPVPE